MQYPKHCFNACCIFVCKLIVTSAVAKVKSLFNLIWKRCLESDFDLNVQKYSCRNHALKNWILIFFSQQLCNSLCTRWFCYRPVRGCYNVFSTIVMGKVDFMTCAWKPLFVSELRGYIFSWLVPKGESMYLQGYVISLLPICISTPFRFQQDVGYNELLKGGLPR